VDQVRQLAASKRVTPSQLAIAWVLARGDDVVAIPGTKRRSYLEENLGALDVELTGEDLAAIEKVTPRGSVAGERYTPEHMANVDA
jgi:aryl-alcohol dehydrogenase-like predicted oxidoreductase